MLVIPLLFSRLGVKWMIVCSLAAWVLRYSLFAGAAAYSSLWMVMTAIILHGICFDFLYVVGAIYVDKKSTPENRGQAQGLFVFITTGIGQMIGTMVTGWLFNYWVDAGGHTPASWQMYWSVLAVFSALVMIAFVFLFNDHTVQPTNKNKSDESAQT
jgi:MFS family permease